MTAKNTGQSDDPKHTLLCLCRHKSKKNQQVDKNTRFEQQMFLLLKTAFWAGINHEKKKFPTGKKLFPSWVIILIQLGRPNVKSEFLTKNLDIKFGGKP